MIKERIDSETIISVSLSIFKMVFIFQIFDEGKKNKLKGIKKG